MLANALNAEMKTLKTKFLCVFETMSKKTDYRRIPTMKA